ncbi:MAG: twin-arginine translocase TatA/TatE family subunit [Pseudoflavonifractor sp.]|nr:twin-arginine translocase TatA/TatE family subunit [Pseudoflavonifractor sp.]
MELLMTIGFIGTTELMLIGGMALLLFGGKKLPEMMRGLGRGVREFKKGVNGLDSAMSDTDSEDKVSNKSSDVSGSGSGGTDADRADSHVHKR